MHFSILLLTVILLITGQGYSQSQSNGGNGALTHPLEAAGAVAGLRLVPVVACRVVDTRPGEGITGPLGPPSLDVNETRILPVPQGRCAIPSTAKGYSLNVTVIPLEPLAYITLWGDGAKPFVSTLNSFHGGVVANAAITPAGGDGVITVFSTNRTHLIIDINGYFLGESSTAPALAFYTLTPCRLVDTRFASAVGLGTPALVASAVRGFPLFLGSCQLPAWAKGL
jgi:hypothetical protein